MRISRCLLNIHLVLVLALFGCGGGGGGGSSETADTITTGSFPGTYSLSSLTVTFDDGTVNNLSDYPGIGGTLAVDPKGCFEVIVHDVIQTRQGSTTGTYQVLNSSTGRLYLNKYKQSCDVNFAWDKNKLTITIHYSSLAPISSNENTYGLPTTEITVWNKTSNEATLDNSLWDEISGVWVGQTDSYIIGGDYLSSIIIGIITEDFDVRLIAYNEQFVTGKDHIFLYTYSGSTFNPSGLRFFSDTGAVEWLWSSSGSYERDGYGGPFTIKDSAENIFNGYNISIGSNVLNHLATMYYESTYDNNPDINEISGEWLFDNGCALSLAIDSSGNDEGVIQGTDCNGNDVSGTIRTHPSFFNKPLKNIYDVELSINGVINVKGLATYVILPFNVYATVSDDFTDTKTLVLALKNDDNEYNLSGFAIQSE